MQTASRLPGRSGGGSSSNLNIEALPISSAVEWVRQYISEVLQYIDMPRTRGDPAWQTLLMGIIKNYRYVESWGVGAGCSTGSRTLGTVQIPLFEASDGLTTFQKRSTYPGST